MKHALFLGLVGMLFAGCSDEPVGPVADAAADVQGDGAVGDTGIVPGDVPVVEQDVPDPHMGLRLPRCEDTEPAGESALMPLASTLLGTRSPMATRVAMPSNDAMMNPALETGEMAYRARMFDRWQTGPAWTRVRRTELGGPSAAPTSGRKSIAWFVMLADTQLVDDESPARLALVDNPGNGGALRAQEAYLPRARCRRSTARSARRCAPSGPGSLASSRATAPTTLTTTSFAGLST